MRPITDWTLFWSAICGIFAVASVIVAIIFYYKAEQRSLIRVRSEQLLIAIEKIIEADYIITKRVAIYAGNLIGAKDHEAFIKRVMNLSDWDEVTKEQTKCDVALITVEKILTVYPESNLKRELNDLRAIEKKLMRALRIFIIGKDADERKSAVSEIVTLQVSMLMRAGSIHKAVSNVDLVRIKLL